MSYQYRTPDGWRTYLGSGPPVNEQGLLADIYNAVYGGGGGAGRYGAQSALIPITTASPKDSISLAAYAGKFPVSIIGIKSTGLTEPVSSAAGYEVVVPSTSTLAGAQECALISSATNGYGGSSLVIGAIGPAFYLTGVGTTLKWNTGAYTAVLITYLDNQTTSSTMPTYVTLGPTVAGTFTYSNSSISGAPVFVILGSIILDASEYTISGTSIILDNDPGDGQTIILAY